MSQSTFTSIVNGSVAPAAREWPEEADRNWYAAYTAPCHEKQVAGQFAVRRLEHFLPLYTSARRWADGRAVIRECPLFPSYVFVRISRQERARVLSVPGMLWLVGTSKGATPLPAIEVETLRESLHLCHAVPHPFLAVGEKARIRSGPLAGIEGIVQRHNHGARIVLSLELIMQSIAIEVDMADLEPAEFRVPNLAPKAGNFHPAGLA